LMQYLPHHNLFKMDFCFDFCCTNLAINDAKELKRRKKSSECHHDR